MTDEYWTLPLCDLAPLEARGLPSYYRDWIDHPTHDDYWKRWSIDTDYSRITVPALHFTGWYDGFLRGTVDNYVGMRAVGHAEQRLVVWPWTHEPWTPVWGSDDSNLGFMSADDVHLAWFDRLLKGTGEPEAAVSTYILHDGWRDFPGGPPPETRTRELYLRSGGRANSRHGDGGALGRGPGRRAGRRLHLRPRPPHMERGRPLVLRRVGHPDGAGAPGRGRVDEGRARLHERASGRRRHAGGERRGRPARRVDRGRHRLRRPPVRGRPGRDVAKPAGGAVRGRYRNGFEAPEPLVPGEPVEYRLRLGPVGIRIPRGYRLRVDIASSDFPLGDRNLNSGGPIGKEGASAGGVAVQTVFHDAGRPSRVVLPVLGGSL